MLTKLSFVLVLLFCIISLGACAPKEKPTSAENTKIKLQKQLQLDYKNPDLHYQMGKMHQTDGLWYQAENEFRVALSFDPVHKPSQAALIKNLLKSGQSAQAKETIKFFMNSAATSENASLELGIAFQNESLDDYALSSYQRALTLSPSSARVNRQLGFFYLKKGDKEKAKQHLIISFNANPYQADVAGELGRLGVAIQSNPSTKTKPAVQPDIQK